MATNLEQEDVSCIGRVTQTREGGRSRMAVTFFVVLLVGFVGSVSLAIFACRESFNQEVIQGARPRFVLFGDSITVRALFCFTCFLLF